MSPSGRRLQAGSVNVTRNVKPRDLADWPACRFLALFFWSWAALITFSPVLLLAVLSVAWMQPLTSVIPLAKVTVLQVGLIAAVLTPSASPPASAVSPAPRSSRCWGPWPVGSLWPCSSASALKFDLRHPRRVLRRSGQQLCDARSRRSITSCQSL